MLIAFLTIILTDLFDKLTWENLVFIAFFLFLPTILRLIDFSIFDSENKKLRFLFRFLLGSAITIGTLSIFAAENIYFQLVQVFIGLSLYTAISLKRIRNKDSFAECRQCTFVRSPNCPGFRPFHE